MGQNSSRLSFGEVAISTQLCYSELKQKSINEPVVSYNNHIPIIPTSDNVIISKYDFKNGISSNPTNFKIGKFAGGYTVSEQEQIQSKNIPNLPQNITVVWIGPRTRVRFYESNNFTGNSVTIENNSYNSIHMVDCADLDKTINRNNIKSMYVSVLGDVERELEAFNDNSCMSMEKFLTILIVIFLIYYLLKYRI